MSEFCTNCGTTIGPGDRFCPTCGSPVSASAPGSEPMTERIPAPETPPWGGDSYTERTGGETNPANNVYAPPTPEYVPPAPAYTPPAYAPPAPRKKRGGKVVLAIILSLLGVLILGVGALYAYVKIYDTDFISVLPTVIVGQERKADNFIELGDKLSDEGDADAAIEKYTAAIEVDDTRFDAYVSRGDSYLAAGNRVSAAADYAKAVELDKGAADIYLKLIDIYVADGDRTNALYWVKEGFKATDDEDIRTRYIPVERITLPDIGEYLRLDATGSIKAEIFPVDTTDKIAYESSDSSVIEVSKSGEIDAISVGKADVTVTCGDLKPEKRTITVFVPIEDILLNAESIDLELGEEAQIVASIAPESAASAPLSFTIASGDNFTVSDNGTVTAAAYSNSARGSSGTVTVSASDRDGTVIEKTVAVNIKNSYAAEYANSQERVQPPEYDVYWDAIVFTFENAVPNCTGMSAEFTLYPPINGNDDIMPGANNLNWQVYGCSTTGEWTRLGAIYVSGQNIANKGKLTFDAVNLTKMVVLPPDGHSGSFNSSLTLTNLQYRK